MSTTQPAKKQEFEATERIEAPQGGPGRGPMGGGMVGQKAMDFGPSAKRLVGQMRPDRGKAIAVVRARCRQRRADVDRPADPRPRHRPGLQRLHRPADPGPAPRTSALAARRVAGSMDVVPGQGVDFTAVGARADDRARDLRRRLAAGLAAGLHPQHGRAEHRPPDARGRRGEDQPAAAGLLRPLARAASCCSRVTNDIDNVSQTLQQTMSQLLTSLMTVVAVLAMMFWISPLLALVALVTVPLSLIVTAQIMKRSQGQFVAQWRRTGKLNAQIEEAYSGHALVKVFGRQAEVERALRRGERRALQGQLRRPVRERADHAVDDVHREPQLRAGRRRRWPAGRQRLAVAGRRAGVHPVQPPVHPAAHHGRVDGQPAAVGRRVGRAGLRAARRRRGAGRRRRARRARRTPRARSPSSTCRSGTTRTGR